MTITIAGIDRTKYIKWKSLRINNILTNQVDTCKFELKQKLRDGTTFSPINGSEVVVTHSGVKLFGGLILKIKNITDDFANVNFEIECIDYTRLLDAKLIAKDYQDMTVNDIIADINTNFLTGFTINNVNCQTVIEYISFRYHTVSQAIKMLADATQFNWWIDYDKDIHFIANGVDMAPTDITDTNGTYEKDSLIIRNDNTQLRNVVFVRGGEYLGDTFTANYISDGTQNVFPLTYRYEAADFKVTVTGTDQEVGQEPTEVPEQYDLLWNDEARLIRFHRASRLPSNGSAIKVAGRRFLPVIAKVKDSGAIVDTQSVEGGSGEHEYIIIDKSIISKEAARQRANAELLAYASSLVEGEFVTQTAGFEAGQQVKINSTQLNVNQNFIVSKVVRKMLTPDTPIYQITLITTRTYGIIEFFQDLLNKDKITLQISSNEITDTVESGTDELELTETVKISTSHNPQTEALDLAETLTAQSLDWPIEFVYHEQVPTGFKRGGSYGGAEYQ